MKMLQMLLGVGMAFALLGANVAYSDIRNVSLGEGRLALTFESDLGDGTIVTNSFCDNGLMGGVGGTESRGTCMTTPGGPEMSILLDLPPIIPALNYGYTTPQAVLAPINSLNSPPSPYTPYTPGRGGRVPRDPRIPDVPDPNGPDPNGPDPNGPDPPPGVVVPAPATLVIVGLGLVGVAVMRRRKLTR